MKVGMLILEEALGERKEQYRRHIWTDYVRLNIYRKSLLYYPFSMVLGN